MTARRTPLYEQHDERGARFTDFGGWEMPVQFDSIRVEHEAVRQAVGVFDVSHMGEIVVSGPDAGTLCQRLVTSDVADLSVGQAQYAGITDEDGYLLDDTMLFRTAREEILFVPNAGKDEAMYDRWREFRDRWNLDVEVENETESYGMLAVQGPSSPETISEVTDADIAGLGKFEFAQIEIEGIECWCSRTGYTGEDGFELLAPWEGTVAVDAALDGTRCGLGARDTLRLEMGYLLGGNEFDQDDNERTPLEAGIDFAVDLDATPHFVGRDALLSQREAGIPEQLVGIELTERGIPRHGYRVLDTTGEPIGTVTSGTMSPTLGRPIGLAYIETAATTPGADVAVRIRDDEKTARIVIPPFLDEDNE